MSSAIANNPFTPANSSLIASLIQQTTAYGQGWPNYTTSPAFPSGHASIGNINAMTFAILAPGYFQQLLQSGVDFGFSRNVFAAHYPLDVIGGRIIATYVTAETLAGTIRCTRPRPGHSGQSPLAQPGHAGLSRRRRQFALRGGLRQPRRALRRQRRDPHRRDLHPGGTELRLLPDLRSSVGRRHDAGARRAGGRVLADQDAVSLPQHGAAHEILATTELPSGGPLDNGTGWARLNLYAAAGGYGAFPAPSRST